MPFINGVSAPPRDMLLVFLDTCPKDREVFIPFEMLESPLRKEIKELHVPRGVACATNADDDSGHS